MPKRTTIYVADDVAAALEASKDQINVSHVCTRALKQELYRMQLMEAGEEDHQALITRLRQEKLDSLVADERARPNTCRT